jgi:hypothetical protein
MRESESGVRTKKYQDNFWFIVANAKATVLVYKNSAGTEIARVFCAHFNSCYKFAPHKTWVLILQIDLKK